jgi:hypothetical protein
VAEFGSGQISGKPRPAARIYASRLMIEPLEIPLESSVAVALLVWSSGEELNNTGVELAEPVEDPVLDDELVAVEELLELPDELEVVEPAEPDVGVVG